MASSSTDIHSRKGKKKSGSPKQAVVPVNKSKFYKIHTHTQKKKEGILV